VGASFVREDLRGQSLANRDLSGSDFTGSDLRGADFSHADLRGAVFRGARTGLPAPAVGARLALGAVLGAASGFAASWTGDWIRHGLFGPRPGMQVLALFVASEIIVYAVATVWRGAPFAMRHVTLPMLAIIATATVVVLLTGLGGARDVGIALAAAACVFFIAFAIGAGALARSSAQSGSNWLLLFVVVGTVVGVRLSTGVGVAASVAVLATLAGLRAHHGHPFGGAASIALQRTMSLGGTSFRDANLQDADFCDACLRNTDFRGAQIDQTHWNDPREVDFCRFDPGVRAPAKAPSKKRRNGGPA
jgi:hypothetical protein